MTLSGGKRDARTNQPQLPFSKFSDTWFPDNSQIDRIWDVCNQITARSSSKSFVLCNDLRWHIPTHFRCESLHGHPMISTSASDTDVENPTWPTSPWSICQQVVQAAKQTKFSWLGWERFPSNWPNTQVFVLNYSVSLSESLVNRVPSPDLTCCNFRAFCAAMSGV